VTSWRLLIKVPNPRHHLVPNLPHLGCPIAKRCLENILQLFPTFLLPVAILLNNVNHFWTVLGDVFSRLV
jgi:hypothetical protein